MTIHSKLRSAFGDSSDPTGPLPKLKVIQRGVVAYPDKTQFLPAPSGQSDLGTLPWESQACIFEGNQQGKKQAELARREIEAFAGKASGLTFTATLQTEQALRHKAMWENACDRLDHARTVLTDYVLHSGRGWMWLYALVWFTLILADVAGGTLVLIKVGEYPLFALILTTGVGVAAVTSAKLAEDFRRRLLWLRHCDNLPSDNEAKRLVTNVFIHDEKPYMFVTRIATLVAVTTACLVVGTLAIRITRDGPFMSMGFALWAAGICGGSFVNAWAHTDPAHTALRNFEDAEAEERKKRDRSPVDAIAQRATNVRAIDERLLAHHGAAMALWYTKLAEAADIMAANPQMAGHGTDGLSFLFKIRPAFEDDFQLLADDYQVALPVQPSDGEFDVDAGEDEEHAAIIDLATRLSGNDEPGNAVGERTLIDLALDEFDDDETGS